MIGFFEFGEKIGGIEEGERSAFTGELARRIPSLFSKSFSAFSE